MQNALFDIFLKLLVSFGIPYLLAKFPGIPANLKAIMEALVEEIKKQKAEMALAKGKAIEEVKACYGIGCPPAPKE